MIGNYVVVTFNHIQNNTTLMVTRPQSQFKTQDIYIHLVTFYYAIVGNNLRNREDKRQRSSFSRWQVTPIRLNYFLHWLQEINSKVAQGMFRIDKARDNIHYKVQRPAKFVAKLTFSLVKLVTKMGCNLMFIKTYRRANLVAKSIFFCSDKGSFVLHFYFKF